MAIRVADQTHGSSAPLQEAVRRWDAALAGRGIDVQYESWAPASCPDFERRDDGVAVVFDQCPRSGSDELAWGQYFTMNGAWSGGLVRIATMLGAEAGVDELVHELGHVFQLSHQPDSVDSCMHRVVSGGYPSALDVANALLGYPPPEPAPPPVSPPHHRDHKHRKHHH